MVKGGFYVGCESWWAHTVRIPRQRSRLFVLNKAEEFSKFYRYEQTLIRRIREQ